MPVATQESWKILPMPMKRVPLGFDASYDDSDAEKIMCGLIPKNMEDKWFIYFKQGWLYFHRSWTGACIYGIRLDSSSSGVRVVDSWVSRDPDQYKGDDLEYDRKLVCFIVDAFLLHKPAQFPRPSELDQPVPGAYQHHLVGRAYPEVEHAALGTSNSLWNRFKKWLERKKNLTSRCT
jgi:hypothetical protein